MKKDSRFIQLILTSLFLLFFGTLGFFGAYYLAESANNITGVKVLYTIFIIVVSFPLHVILHEIGHLLGGLSSGYQFIMFRLFSTVWIKTKNRLSRRKQYVPGIMGQALMSPPSDNNRVALLVYNAGGVLMNLMTALIFIVFSIVNSNETVGYSLITSAVVAFLLIIMSLIPVQGTDGYNMIQIYKKEETQSELINILSLYRDMVHGATFEELQKYINLDKISSLQEPTAVNQYDVKASYLLETGDFEGAFDIYQMLYENKDRIFPGHQPDITLNYLFMLLLYKPDHPDVLKIQKNKIYKKYQKIKQANYFRVYATVSLYLEHDYAKTEKLLQQGEKYIPLSPTVTDEFFEIKLYKDLNQDLNSKKT